MNPDPPQNFIFTCDSALEAVGKEWCACAEQDAISDVIIVSDIAGVNLALALTELSSLSTRNECCEVRIECTTGYVLYVDIDLCFVFCQQTSR